MDIYLLEKGTYERIAVLDDFSSFIWTERMSSPGDFEMELPPSDVWSSLTLGRHIAHTDSSELMIIESRLESTSTSGETMLKISGRSMDSILEKRSVLPSPGKEHWTNHGPVWEAVYELVRNFALRSTSLGGTKDLIPDMYIYQDVNEQLPVFDLAVPIQDLYTAVQDLCDSRDYSFGIDLVNTSPRLRFYVKEGDTRPLYFSPQLDTLESPSYLHSTESYYNVAYVWSKEALHSVVVGSSNSTGLNRRVLSIYASDLSVDDDTTLSQLRSQMRQRGLEELAKHKEQKLVDGTVSSVDTYVYRTHYFLGDVVNLVDSDSNVQKVRVSEFIFAQDQEGLRSYPTFTTVI